MTFDTNEDSANFSTSTDAKSSDKKALLSSSTKRKRKNPPFTGDDILFNPVRGESALWVAVITQAMMDALSKSKNKEAQYHKHEAIRWLTESSKDFIEVCLNAGLNPDDVRRKAKKAIANPTLWRAEAGAGKRYIERKTYREKQKLKTRPKTTTPPTSQIIIGPWA